MEFDSAYNPFEDTMPFDDLVLNQTEEIDYHTQLVDCVDPAEYDDDADNDDDDEKKIVLDSEDEEISGTKIFEFGTDEPFKQWKDESSKNSECGDMVTIKSTNHIKDLPQSPSCNQEVPRLSYFQSEEPGESSQSNALAFVENFLSSNDTGHSPDTKPVSMVRKNLSSLSCAKGSYSLAKFMQARKDIGKTGAFEWDNGERHCRIDVHGDKVNASFIFCGDQQQSVTNNWSSRNVDGSASSSSGNEVTGLPHPNSETQNHASHIERQSENVENKQNEQLHPVLSGQEFETDMLDTVFSTQMAAEAIEALAHTPPVPNSAYAYQVPEKLVVDSPRSIPGNKVSSLRTSLGQDASIHAESTPGESKKSKCLATNQTFSLSRNDFIYELDDKLIRKKIKKEIAKYAYSSKTVKTTSFSKEKVQGSSVGHLTELWIKGENFQVDKNGPTDIKDRSNSVVKKDVITYITRRSYSSVSPPDLLSSVGKYDQVHKQARSYKVSQKNGSIQEAYDLFSSLNLESWRCPKRKRKHCKPPSCASRTRDLCNSFTTSDVLSSFANFQGNEDGPTYLKDRSSDIMKKELITWNQSSVSPPDVLSSVGKYDPVYEQAGSNKVSPKNGSIREAYDLASSLNLQARMCPKRKRMHCKPPSFVNRNRNLCTSFTTFEGKQKQKGSYSQQFVKPFLSKELNSLGVHEPKPDFASRNLRIRRSMAHVRVLFSQHLDDNIIKQQKKISTRLGISTASFINDATHFIADRFIRTKNMLEAIGCGKPIVTHLWLESCAQASCLIDENNFILRDAKKENEIGFNLGVSLAHARHHSLLEGRTVLITPNVKPDEETISSLVKAVNGQLQTVAMTRVSALMIQVDLLILSCEEDHAICAPFLDKGVAVYSTELLLNGIIIQKLEYKRHQLFMNLARNNSFRRRKDVVPV
ncbi:hypothetical protein K2173_002989 [Erythroxylum novogranatense]|uniref:BRCT domain-containing protein n=1 Tax=Erythroxylum novogranatense TaxID=1862640 RepID=A0AAV8S8B0_9ROSI|nr:hypothetical protein K2173_002989 [Erythroxylum novogranatense]